MKVLCIDGVVKGLKGVTGRKAEKHEEIYEGDVYTAIDEVVAYNGEEGYILLERGPFASYRKRRFIPLSEIDETELVNQKEYA